MDATIQHQSQKCVAYFEEYEPRVPAGFTGWYHSYGWVPIKYAEQVFDESSGECVSPVKPEIAGPFATEEDALADMEAHRRR